MKKKLDKNVYIDKMVDRLPVLRASIRLTQEQLSSKVGVSRQTIVAIENKKREMPWSLYLSIVCVFMQYDEIQPLIKTLDIFSPEFIKSL